MSSKLIPQQSSRLENLYAELFGMVFRAIADHEDFRHHVKEIIWDDVRLPGRDALDRPPGDSSPLDCDSPEPEGAPDWFIYGCKQSCLLQFMYQDNGDRGIEALPLEELWNYYKKLLQQQDNVITSEADGQAFRYGLRRFGSLKRVILTVATHGALDNPLYETPMIRAFPRGFNYPLPVAYWPLGPKGRDAYTGSASHPYECTSWDLEEERSKWRAFSIIMRELANQKHKFSEFLVDVNEIETGLSSRVFDKPNEAYNNLVTLLQQPGFKRLDLALLGNCQYFDVDNKLREEPIEREPWSSFRSGLLKRAFENIKDPHHVSLRVQISEDYARDSLPGDNLQWFLLENLFPIGKWQNLRHFGISGIVVALKDLIAMLKTLPLTLRSVELSFLLFKDESEMYYHLAESMREELGWSNRVESERPAVSMHVPHHYMG